MTAEEFPEDRQYDLAEYDEGGFIGINTKAFNHENQTRNN